MSSVQLRALAKRRHLAAEGAKVVLVDRNQTALEKVASDLPSDRALAHVADVSDSHAAYDMVGTCVKCFGRLDALVNNAGVHEGGDPAQVTNDQWCKVVATEVDGVFYCFRAALTHLEKTKGSIVNTASVFGLGGDWRISPYNAANGTNLTRALAMDMGKKKIRINAVFPSLTRTGMMYDKELLAKFAERIPLGSVCEPKEIASVIAFLASDDASFMTGANVAVEGGVNASNGQSPPQLEGRFSVDRNLSDLRATSTFQVMNDRSQAAWPDIECGKRDRQLEAPRPRTSRVHVKHPIDHFDHRFMRVSGDDHVDVLGHGIDAKRLEIVENVNGLPCEPHELGVGIVSRPVTGVHVSSDRRDRRDPPKRCEHIGRADVPAMNDVIDAGETVFRLRPQQTVRVRDDSDPERLHGLERS